VVAGRAESITVNACGLVQGIALVTFPAASFGLTVPSLNTLAAAFRPAAADKKAEWLYQVDGEHGQDPTEGHWSS